MILPFCFRISIKVVIRSGFNYLAMNTPAMRLANSTKIPTSKHCWRLIQPGLPKLDQKESCAGISAINLTVFFNCAVFNLKRGMTYSKFLFQFLLQSGNKIIIITPGHDQMGS
jgi:hypothetical protein